MVSDQEFRKLAEKGWSEELETILEQGIPDSQMQILIELDLVGEPDDDLPPEIDDAVDEELQELLEEGNDLMDRSKFPAAIQSFHKVIEMLPGPPHEYDYALHAYAGIGDAHFMMDQFPEMIDPLEQAKKCPGGLGNPFIHLRLGQGYLELNHHDQAADELMRAYMAAGAEIFEDDDPRYLDFLKTRGHLD